MRTAHFKLAIAGAILLLQRCLSEVADTAIMCRRRVRLERKPDPMRNARAWPALGAMASFGKKQDALAQTC